MTQWDAKTESCSTKEAIAPKLQIVAWEVTRRCNLLCAHCRASAADDLYEGELSTEECMHLVDDILAVGKPILILSGGEPLMRHDLFEVAKYAAARGLRVALGTNGTLITREVAALCKEVPVSRVGISLDFPTPQLQDEFRGKEGAFKAVMRGIDECRRAGLDVQINTTVTRMNVSHLDNILSMCLDMGAVAFHPFMLVPTGRGKGLSNVALSPDEYERILNWVYDKQMELGDKIFIKPTDAPHYFRVVSQRRRRGDKVEMAPSGDVRPAGHPGSLDSFTRGCLAGVSFCFVSHRGRVQGCGYLDVDAGDVRKEGFVRAWNDSPLFRELRDLSSLKGKCGVCEYKRMCGGCRARAYEATGDWLAPEPYCIYEPQGTPMTDHRATTASEQGRA